jgi:hypothetical protein
VGARLPWRASLAFLRHVPEAPESLDSPDSPDGGDEVLQLGALDEVLLSNDTWLHAVCGDLLDAYFDAQAEKAAKDAPEQAQAKKGKGDA